MNRYPLDIPRDYSRAKRGRARRLRLNELAGRIEGHVNAELRDKPPGDYSYIIPSLAIDLGVDVTDVRAALRLYRGFNHFIVRKIERGAAAPR